MTKTKLNALLATTAVLALTACGGGGTSNGSALNPTIQQSYNSNVKLSATQNVLAVMRFDFDSRTTSIVPKQEFAIQKTNEGKFSILYEGSTYIFTEENAVLTPEGRIAGYRNNDFAENGIFVEIYDPSIALSDLQDGSQEDFAFLVDYGIYLRGADGSVAGDFGFSVLGTRSPNSAFGNFTSENYVGAFNAEILPAQYDVGTSSPRAVRDMLKGDLTVIADFSNQVLTGSVANMSREKFDQQVSQGREMTDGTIQLKNGTITNGAFSGDMTFDAELMTTLDLNTLDAGYSGAFYGPNVEQVGGVVSGTGTRTDGDVNIIGGFVGSR